MKTGKTALITGASSGIGAAFARQLAADGYNLVLVARRRERLESLATELMQRHNISAEVLVADLAKDEDIEQVAQRIEDTNTLDMLINNAGFSTMGPFAENERSSQLDIVQVHVTACTALCHAALQGMLERRCGTIINVASIAAFLPGPGGVTYSATKNYMVTFSKALQTEVQDVGIKVQVLCPGFTYSEFHDTTHFEQFDRASVPKGLWMTSEDVAIDSLRALNNRQVVHISGLKNRFLVLLSSIMMHVVYTNPLLRPMLQAVRMIRRKVWG